MLSELQKRKLTALFHQWDGDSDGFLTKADYAGFATRICKLWKYAPGSPEYKTLYAQNVAVWDYVQNEADKDKDGRVSLDEYLVSWDATLGDQKMFDRMVVQYGTAVLQLADVDRDGKMSRAEFVGLLGCYGVSEKDAQEAFRRLDVDGTGYLNNQQALHRYQEFLGDDPDAPGNWMIGPY